MTGPLGLLDFDTVSPIPDFCLVVGTLSTASSSISSVSSLASSRLRHGLGRFLAHLINSLFALQLWPTDTVILLPQLLPSTFHASLTTTLFHARGRGIVRPFLLGHVPQYKSAVSQ